MVLIPWETLPSEMTKDFNDRTKLSTCRMFLVGIRHLSCDLYSRPS